MAAYKRVDYAYSALPTKQLNKPFNIEFISLDYRVGHGDTPEQAYDARQRFLATILPVSVSLANAVASVPLYG